MKRYISVDPGIGKSSPCGTGVVVWTNGKPTRWTTFRTYRVPYAKLALFERIGELCENIDGWLLPHMVIYEEATIEIPHIHTGKKNLRAIFDLSFAIGGISQTLVAMAIPIKTTTTTRKHCLVGGKKYDSKVAAAWYAQQFGITEADPEYSEHLCDAVRIGVIAGYDRRK